MCYAIESGLARTEKIAARGGELGPVAMDAVRVFASDAADRIMHAGKQVVRALVGAGRGSGAGELIAAVAAHPGVDTVAARRRIADAVHPRGAASLLANDDVIVKLELRIRNSSISIPNS